MRIWISRAAGPVFRSVVGLHVSVILVRRGSCPAELVHEDDEKATLRACSRRYLRLVDAGQSTCSEYGRRAEEDIPCTNNLINVVGLER
jgi:hypothetical protein